MARGGWRTKGTPCCSTGASTAVPQDTRIREAFYIRSAGEVNESTKRGQRAHLFFVFCFVLLIVLIVVIYCIHRALVVKVRAVTLMALALESIHAWFPTWLSDFFVAVSASTYVILSVNAVVSKSCPLFFLVLVFDVVCFFSRAPGYVSE